MPSIQIASGTDVILAGVGLELAQPGTISFTVEDGSPAGRGVLDAVGITARASGPAPVRRLGAAEFPANILPSAPR